jgi:ABC-type methionine transport system permease subunit
MLATSDSSAFIMASIMALKESLQILSATAFTSALALPVAVALAVGSFGECSGIRRALSFLRWIMDASVPLIILSLILYPDPYKRLFAFSSSNASATIWGLAFLFALRFLLAVDLVLRERFKKERDVLLALGASPEQSARILLKESGPAWITQYFSSCAGALGVTAGAGLTELAYERGYFFFQFKNMLLVAAFLAALVFLLEGAGAAAGRYWQWHQ